MLVIIIVWPMMPEKKSLTKLKERMKMKKFAITLATVFALTASVIGALDHEKFPQSSEVQTEQVNI